MIADIPNTQLALPGGQEFRAENPSEGITLVTVTQPDANSVRVRVTGVAAPPTAQVVPSASGLVLSLTPAAEEEEIEIVVTGEQEGYRVPDATTATKIPVPQRDIPQSIQTLPRRVIEDRQVVRLNELTVKQIVSSEIRMDGVDMSGCCHLNGCCHLKLNIILAKNTPSGRSGLTAFCATQIGRWHCQQNKFGKRWEQTKVTTRLVVSYFNWIWEHSRLGNTAALACRFSLKFLVLA